MLNKKAGVTLPEVVDEVDEGFGTELFIGGPVQKESLHFIHRHHNLTDTDNEIADDLFWAGNFDTLLDKINTRQVRGSDLKFFLGYSGWSPGQLLDELEQKSWIVCKGVDTSLIFDTPVNDMWREVLKRMGGKYKVIAGYPLDPRLN